MASEARPGRDLVLALSLKLNRRPKTGQAVFVRVLNAEDGAELLASTATTEVSDALYSYLWTDTPGDERIVLVEFTWQSRCFTEFIRFAKGGGGGGMNAPVGILVEEDGSAGVIEEIDGAIMGGADDSNAGTVGEETTEATGLSSENTDAVGVAED